ncbi:uncharacterized protein BT62DRAFT_1003747 [Guyanagaster necrorhizus]|uniref:Uncharacterized protein n=1 Tax=Guyanagaster necrorhizus TaxID=856835 RepID=A0A9P8AU03_9AGAR|nr:uncharacterized protein BT62DRAFT_1003747 [Guyanagaster necrorhizus MCA 3950]KAG7447964.1 hypothetical protein BT62DRAFT_1003747 [Guyanagaster necrorhizus MCA 3950]
MNNVATVGTKEARRHHVYLREYDSRERPAWWRRRCYNLAFSSESDSNLSLDSASNPRYTEFSSSGQTLFLNWWFSIPMIVLFIEWASFYLLRVHIRMCWLTNYNSLLTFFTNLVGSAQILREACIRHVIV